VIGTLIDLLPVSSSSLEADVQANLLKIKGKMDLDL